MATAAKAVLDAQDVVKVLRGERRARFSDMLPHLGRIRSLLILEDLSLRADTSPDLYDLHGLDHVAGWKPYDLRDLVRVSWVGSVQHRSCTKYHNDRYSIHYCRLSRS